MDEYVVIEDVTNADPRKLICVKSTKPLDLKNLNSNKCWTFPPGHSQEPLTYIPRLISKSEYKTIINADKDIAAITFFVSIALFIVSFRGRIISFTTT